MFNDEKSPLNKNNKNFSPKTHSNTHKHRRKKKKQTFWLFMAYEKQNTKE